MWPSAIQKSAKMELPLRWQQSETSTASIHRDSYIHWASEMRARAYRSRISAQLPWTGSALIKKENEEKEKTFHDSDCGCPSDLSSLQSRRWCWNWGTRLQGDVLIGESLIKSVDGGCLGVWSLFHSACQPTWQLRAARPKVQLPRVPKAMTITQATPTPQQALQARSWKWEVLSRRQSSRKKSVPQTRLKRDLLRQRNSSKSRPETSLYQV